MADTSLNNKLLAQAARRAVIVTVEELVDQLSWNPRRMYIPGHMLSAVVPCPRRGPSHRLPGLLPCGQRAHPPYLACAADA
jgi:acyl CoA:acetate/3-ketoacid CoA transferase